MKFNVSGMTCSHCERAIERAIQSLGGQAAVDLATGTVEIAGVADAAAARTAIEAEGYRVDSVADVQSNSGGCCGVRRA